MTTLPRAFSPRATFTVWLSGSVFLLLSPTLGTAQSTKPITVLAQDYAFGAPDSIEAGGILFGLHNKGTVRHEVVVLLLKRGRTMADYLKATTPEERRALSDGLVGLILAEPGLSAPGRLLTDLQKGRSYLLVCNLRDTPEKPPHAQLGMIATLHVK